MSEKVICMGVWLYGCMKNDSARLSKSISKAASRFISYRHTIIHSYLAEAEVGIIII